MGNGGSGPVKATTWDVDRLAQASGLSRLKIEELFSDYVKASGRDGVMDLREFIQLYSTLPVARLQSKSAIREKANRIFRTFDRDHNGTLEFDEFLDAIVMMNHHTSETDPIECLVQENSILFEENDDKRISEQYGLKIIRQINRYHGVLPGTEHKFWKEVDRYNRGYVMREEFVQYIRRQTIYKQ